MYPNSLSASINPATVLIVDDVPQNLTLLHEMLEPSFSVRVANQGERALRAARANPKPDLILLDVMMPGLNGHEVLSQLKEDETTKDIPVIFVTSMADGEDEAYGLKMGAVDYITKPYNPAVVLARINTQLELKRARDLLAHQNVSLDREVAQRMSENLLIQDLNVRALACLAEARDNETGLHVVRTQTYIDVMGRHLTEHPKFRRELEGRRLEMIVKAAPLHDIGKVGIPDSILLKPGKLTAEEFEIMKTHPMIGHDAINKAIEQSLASVDQDMVQEAGSAFRFLSYAAEISKCHHEKWDGSGYPAGLVGDEIPVSARLMALADVFDALMSRRVYKSPMTLDETTQIIVEGRGRHFDPDVVDAFLACRDQFAEIAIRLADTH